MKILITINDAADQRAAVDVEFYPPLTQDTEPTAALQAAMLAIDAIKTGNAEAEDNYDEDSYNDLDPECSDEKCNAH